MVPFPLTLPPSPLRHSMPSLFLPPRSDTRCLCFAHSRCVSHETLSPSPSLVNFSPSLISFSRAVSLIRCLSRSFCFHSTIIVSLSHSLSLSLSLSFPLIISLVCSLPHSLTYPSRVSSPPSSLRFFLTHIVWLTRRSSHSLSLESSYSVTLSASLSLILSLSQSVRCLCLSLILVSLSLQMMALSHSPLPLTRCL